MSTHKSPQMVEVVRSFSYKLSLGRFNPQLQYESRDFFCAQKAECKPMDAEATSERLYRFCKAEVLKAVRESIDEILDAKGRRAA